MNDMKKSCFKNLIKYVFSFFTAFLAFCLVVLVGVFEISKPEYAKYVVTKSDYINNSLAEIEDGLSSIAIPGGFPENFFSYGIGDKTFKDNIYKFIDTVYQNKAYAADSSAFETEVKEKIYAYLEKNQISYTNEISANIDTMVSLCVKEYLTYATPRSIRYMGNYISKLTPLSLYGIIGASAAMLISLVIMILYKSEQKFYLLSLSSAGLMLVVAPVCFLLFAGLKNIGIASKALFGFVTLFIKLFVNFLLISGGILLLICFLWFILSHFVKNKAVKNG